MATYKPARSAAPIVGADAKARVISLGIDKWYHLDQKDEPQVWNKIFKKRTDVKKESYVAAGMAGLGMSLAKNDAEATDMVSMTDEGIKETKFTEYGLGMFASRKDLDDDLTDMIKAQAKELVSAGRKRREAACAGVFGAMFTTTYALDPTSTTKPIISTSHNFATGINKYGTSDTTWSNQLSGNDALSYESLKSAMVLARQIPTREGFPRMGAKFDKLVIGSDLVPTAWEILESEQVAFSNENTKNIFKGRYGLDIQEWLYLDNISTTAWVIIDSKGFDGTWFERKGDEISKDFDKNKGIYSWYLYHRGAADVYNPFYSVGSLGA